MAKTIEETYQKKTPKEHILLRPDTYIGSVDQDTQPMYVYDSASGKIVQRVISYSPGLYKIFDEILVNAADNKIRDPKMNMLRVTISKEKNEISVYNNGKGIPIKIHAKEGCYVPELIFGHLLTGSNYDDSEKKVTGGRNGYGAKLCNIFSTLFIVETADGHKRYKQRFTDNMSVIGEPEIETYRGEEYTKIVFRPDLARFKMTELDDGLVSLLTRRVYDLSGIIKKMNVYFNDVKIEVNSFQEYVQLYLTADDKIVHTIANERWELAFTVSEEQFMQVSFVNSIATSKGGTHVSHVVDQIIDPIIEAIKKKDKSLDVKPIHVKNAMSIFINCLIENPSFDSQTKENLTLRASSFGSKCTPIEKFVKEIVQSTTLVDRVVLFSRAKQSAQLKKSDGVKTSRLTGVPKLEDANLAGTKRSSECTLILTEGDSAKTLAVAGLSVVGRDHYGVFPLRGKLLNVREAIHQQIMANVEITNVKKILGLQQGKVYENTSTLRYGHLMIMTDQDHDGSHIKGLIINFLDHFFPSLLKIEGFLQEFITPIIRAKKGSQQKDFFTIQEYETFKLTHSDWSIKYYKGLGTSTPSDAKQYFSDLPKHVKNFSITTEEDRSLIDLAFNKKKCDLRKVWLSELVPGTFLDQSQPSISVKDFINREFILFSMADNIRSIPSVLDGLKPGQRKILFSCFKKNLKSEIKVAQLVGYISEHSAYHHGEVSLSTAIVNMAHDFVGSNNINLLMPLGSFGSRLQGGKDAASPRYIFTNLNPLTRLIFSELDDVILNYLNEDNLQIEPEHYIPIIPMVLVNGGEGIGTGWSSQVPNFNPLEIINNLRALMQNRDMKPMKPFYRNFRGPITEGLDGKFIVDGIYKEIEYNNIQVTELPIGTWTQTYKEHLESLVQSNHIKDYKEYHTDKTVDFIIAPLKSFTKKLSSIIGTSNMHCFDANNKIKKFPDALSIIKDFYFVRLHFYNKRKEFRLKIIKDELIKLENKVRFIKEVTSDILIINKRKADDIINDLIRGGYEKLDNFDYLLNMKIMNLSKERMDRLISEFQGKRDEYDLLLRKTPFDLWNEDLDKLEAEYIKVTAQETKEYDAEIKNKAKRKDFGKNMRGLPICVRDLESRADVENINKRAQNPVAAKRANDERIKTIKLKLEKKNNKGKKKKPEKINKYEKTAIKKAERLATKKAIKKGLIPADSIIESDNIKEIKKVKKVKEKKVKETKKGKTGPIVKKQKLSDEDVLIIDSSSTDTPWNKYRP